VNVRVIAATNRDLPKMLEEGKFRDDLYYRLRGTEIYLRPLKERLDDLWLLAKHFSGDAQFSDYSILRWVSECCVPARDDIPQPEQKEVLFDWERAEGFPADAPVPLGKGNIRAFKHAVERAIASGQLQSCPEQPFVDQLNVKDEPLITSKCYTQEELSAYDQEAAKQHCRTYKEAAALLGIRPEKLSPSRQNRSRNGKS
jgi:transcriptional regulator with AAA-type ATPase domain